MTLGERLEKEYVQVYKAKDALRLGVLRAIKTAMTNRLVELRRHGEALSDDEILELVVRQIKQRQDSIEQFSAAGRKDLADRESAEMEILKEYLPKALTDEELKTAIVNAIRETGAASLKDMGRVISLVMSRHKGQADGKAVSAETRKLLSAG